MVSGFTPFITTLLFEWFRMDGSGDAVLGTSAAITVAWAALATRETKGPNERKAADKAAADLALAA